MEKLTDAFPAAGSFIARHIGPSEEEIASMVADLGFSSLEDLVNAAIPKNIQLKKELDLTEPLGESEALRKIKELAKKNKIYRSYIGTGYHGTITPPVIQRNILENPGWYTQYTPYQAEIAQGRLEALLNFQTMITDLTGLDIANASLLDEGTAAAEAMSLCLNMNERVKSKDFFVADNCHPQTIAVVKTRAEAIGVNVVVGSWNSVDLKSPPLGILLQYPATDGTIPNYRDLISQCKNTGTIVALAADILSLAILPSPGELGVGIALGNTQRFGVPMGFGGPHAAYFATKDEFKRKIPGRLVGISKDAHGQHAVRLALQTREQHIRRDKATSNICTAQVLLGIMASMYAVYHGPEGIKKIAVSVHNKAKLLACGLRRLGYDVLSKTFFDTVKVNVPTTKKSLIARHAEAQQINLRWLNTGELCISLDETVTLQDLRDILTVFSDGLLPFKIEQLIQDAAKSVLPEQRRSNFLTHPVFNSYHSETELLRYIKNLESRDLSLTKSMIPLGSCTMKLNATAELMPISWPEFNQLHPFAPLEQTQGYLELFRDLEKSLCEITGFDASCLQPNSGAQGEYAGLLTIRAYHKKRKDIGRDICLIPVSAHGTNPASAVMAGMKVVGVTCDKKGNIDLADLEAKAKEHQQNLAALMVTYPSTHGVFEEDIRAICEITHKYGGQVYMDGANMNAQVGHCRPGDFGPDVCHLNLHKTFCIPHGGGGPGVGPIAVKRHLAEFLPNISSYEKGAGTIGPVTSAPWGSASILPISWMYIKMMGARGLKKATEVAILNANYIAKKIDADFPVLYRGKSNLVAHECIIDLRVCKTEAGVEVEDVAKRLMDYGFHAPTISWPVPGTMMIEPTESESKAELDRFCEALTAIREEIREIEGGKADRKNNVLKNAPHTTGFVMSDNWNVNYSREKAAFPKPWCKVNKFWPAVGRIDNAYGDRNLFCACAPVDGYKFP